MAALNTIYNLVNCGSGSVLGTGSFACTQRLKKASALWITPGNFTFDGAETLDADYVQELKAEGNLIILNDIKTFTDNSADDQIETLEDGTELITNEGLYKFQVKFIKGMHYHAALHSLNSFGRYRMLFVDKDNNILGTEAPDGSLRGFAVGMLQGDRLMWATDTTFQREGISFQFTDRNEVDDDYVFISNSELGTFKPSREDGVHEVVIDITAPSDTDTTIVLTAKLKQNKQVFSGAAETDFLLQENGATITTTGMTENPDGTYTFTIPAVATNDVITGQLYDSSNNRAGIVLDNEVYKSNTDSVITVA